MRKTKQLAYLLIMTLCALLLTACGDNVNVSMNADGTGVMGYTLMMEEEEYNEYVAMGLADTYVKQLENLGFKQSTETYKNVKYVDFTKKVEFKTTAELQKLLTNQEAFDKAFMGSSKADSELVPLSTCTVSTTTFQGVYQGLLTRDDIEDFDAEDFGFHRISITFPENVVYTNGTKESDGKTASWVLQASLTDTLLRATTDAAGKNAFAKDTKKPVIYGAKNGVYYRDIVEVRLTDNVGIKKAVVNGKLMGTEEYFYGDGQYNITAYDFDGNVTKITFYIDSTAPTITGVANKKYYNTTKTIKFSDKRGIKSATLNGKAVKSGAKVGRTGSYKLVVTDKANNVRTVSFVIDKVNPTITGVTNGKTYRGTKTIKFSDKYGVKTATLNGNTIRSGKKVSKPGKYTVRVTDKSGNIRTVKFTIKK